MKSSLVYAEIMGLDLALSNLKMMPQNERTNEWSVVAQWLENRLKTLRDI